MNHNERTSWLDERFKMFVSPWHELTFNDESFCEAVTIIVSLTNTLVDRAGLMFDDEDRDRVDVALRGLVDALEAGSWDPLQIPDPLVSWRLRDQEDGHVN